MKRSHRLVDDLLEIVDRILSSSEYRIPRFLNPNQNLLPGAAHNTRPSVQAIWLSNWEFESLKQKKFQLLISIPEFEQ